VKEFQNYKRAFYRDKVRYLRAKGKSLVDIARFLMDKANILNPKEETSKLFCHFFVRFFITSSII
jgi:hypothetical protein